MPTVTTKLPPRRLLAVAAAFALISAQSEAAGGSNSRPKSSLDGSEQVCPLGTFRCTPRPYNFGICRPNAMLDFYDPTLSKDPNLRDTSLSYGWAKHVQSSDQIVYHLSGDVKLIRNDQKLLADTVDYNNDTSDYDARGNVRYQQFDEMMAGTHMRGNDTAHRGIGDNVHYQMLNSRGNGDAQQGQMLDALHTRYAMASYSTCDLGHHVWEFRGKSITLNKDTGVGVARNATMRVGKVPFMYLPYFSFPLDSRRESGFLQPTFGSTSRTGFEISAPYYFNLAPNYDATLDPRIYVSRGFMLAGEFRYMVPGSSGQLDGQFVPNDHGDNEGLFDTKDKQRYLISVNNTTHLWDSWNFVGSYNHASDASYLYDYGNVLTHTVTYTLTSHFAIQGGGNWWNGGLGTTLYQNTDPFAANTVAPYDQLPYVWLNLDIPLKRWLVFGMNNEIDEFRKVDNVEGARADLYPYLAADFGSSAWFVRPKVAYRFTDYQLSGNYKNYGYDGILSSGQTSPFTSQSPSRSLPIISLDSGLVFDRNISLFGDSYTQTLEPRMYYLYVPYRNQDNIPLFNTSEMSFDYWQLFSPNEYSGADRQMNANNLTAAVTSRLLDENGVERLSASFGQIRYFSPQKVQLPNGQNTVTETTHLAGSDYVAQLDMQLDDRWRVSTDYQWNPDTRRTDMAALDFQGRLFTDGIIDFSYHYRRNLLEQYSASVVYPVSPNWRLIGSWTYSPLYHTTVEALAGVEYDSCCITLRLVDRNYDNEYDQANTIITTGAKRDNAIMFEVVFKGLGSSGGQIESALRRDILGYQ